MTSSRPSKQSLSELLDLKAIRREKASRKLIDFTRYTFPAYSVGWVHRDIAARLDAFIRGVINGESPRLMLFVPPRHGKSELVSRRLPAFLLGRCPDASIIATSYGSDLASRMNRDVQRIIDSDAYREVFPDTQLFGKNVRAVAGGSFLRNSDIFEVVGHQGVYRSTGIGGGITGMGASCLIVDDPLKDREEADSEAFRNRAWEWYTSTGYTRLAPGGGVLLVQTRWHEDDLAGRLKAAMAVGGDQWDIIDYPAIAEQDEEHRRAGDALDANRYPLERLLKIKAVVGPRDWASLYQQRPAPAEGGTFKRAWLAQFYREAPATFDEVLQSWDLAFKGTDTSDFVVGQVWGRKGADKYLLDQVRGRLDFPATVAAIRTLSAKWPAAQAKLVEDKANGPALIAALKHEIPGLIGVNPDGSKIARASAVTPSWEAGNVWLPDPSIAPWVHDFIEEHAAFPSGAHDDQVDAAAQALRRLTTQSAETDLTFDPEAIAGFGGQRSTWG